MVTTPRGTLHALVHRDVVQALGVPYAHAERYGLPEPAHLREPYLADTPAPAAPQPTTPVAHDVLGGGRERLVISEDCLRLSVTAPHDAVPGEDLPVMVWLHGGSYVGGAGDLPIYDPIPLVRQERVVVVSVTYRLGVLGYLGFGGGPANLGLLDQIEALRWVRDAVAAFGGDPAGVTVFGQSAGGDSAAHLMIAAGARGLMRRAIVQSAPLGIVTGRESMYRAMLRAAGTPRPGEDLEAVLRRQARASTAGFLTAGGLRGGMPFGLRYGHRPLPAERDREAAWRAVAPQIDLMIGNTTQEAALFTRDRSGRDWILTEGGLIEWSTRRIYADGADHLARLHREAGGTAVRYLLDWRPQGTLLGARHNSDLPLLLGTPQAWEGALLIGATPPQELERLAAPMRAVWGEFARTGSVSEEAAQAAAEILTLS